MKKFLEDNKDLLPDNQPSDSLAILPYEDMKKLYVKTIKLSNKKNVEAYKQEENKKEKIKIRFIKRDNRLRMQTFKNHNLVLTKHFREKNLQSC